MKKDTIRKNLWHSSKKSIFHLILGEKICILPNFTVKKSAHVIKFAEDKQGIGKKVWR